MEGKPKPLASREFRAGLEAAPDAMLIVDAQGVIDFVNAQADALFGYAQDEMLGQRVELLLPERYRTSHVAHRKNFFTAPRRRSMGESQSLFARKKNGDEFPIDVSLSDIELDGVPLAVAAIRDTTAQQQISDALRVAKEEAEQATASKSRFLAAASHDLRQPLQALGLYLSILEGTPDQPNQPEILDRMRQSLDAMAALQNALLDISKLDSGSLVPEQRDFPVRQLLERIVSNNVQQAAEKALTLEWSGSDCVVHSDRALLERIVENFVTNAIHYTDQGRIEIVCQCTEHMARIEVRDTGPGIPKKELDKIFGEYYQLSNPERTRRKGLGLGLAIAKRIARLLGHSLEVTSVLGESSTFSVEVPLGELVEQPARMQATRQTSGQGERQRIVLLIDDDPAIIDAMTLLFTTLDFEVHGALDGDEALANITRGVCPDVIISDYRLPGDNGIEVLRRVRHDSGKDVPAILLTGDTSGQEIEATNLSRCTVMHKPVNADQLIEQVNHLVGGE